MGVSLLPSHLAGRSAAGLPAGERVGQFEIGGARNFVYVLADWDARVAAIVDPQADLRRPLAALQEHGLTLAAVLLTHSHWDHTAGVGALLQGHPELPLYCHPQDAHRLDPAWTVQAVQDGQILRVGSLEVEVLHTPGHSAGECCYLVRGEPPCLFTGDTLFIRDCGRCDLDTGSVQAMFTSLQRIRALPGDPLILPGHHYAPECASTLERERQESPPLKCRSVAELAGLP